VDAKTEELRDAHDALAEVYASRLAHVMDELPAAPPIPARSSRRDISSPGGADRRGR
jgi:hypothetical protein